MGALEVTQERLIRARPEAVVAYATDPANDVEWIGNTRRVRVLTEGPVEVGSRVERTAAILGRSVDYTLEVVEKQPGRRMVMRALAGPLRIIVRYEFEDAANGTLMRVGVTVESERLRWVVRPVVHAVTRLSLARDLRTLEDRLLRR